MDNKESIISGLENVKLVIGNGFDLHCKLKTKYKDYFLSNVEKIESLKRWYDEFKYNVHEYLNFNSSSYRYFWVEPSFFDKLTFWDFLFFIKSRKDDGSINDWNWCDV